MSIPRFEIGLAAVSVSAEGDGLVSLSPKFPRRRWRLVWSMLLLIPAFNAFCASAPDPEAGADDDDADDLTSLSAFNVQADRIEDFGLRVSALVDRERMKMPLWPVATPVVSSILPNTAASKAGLKPGEWILKSDGKSTGMTLFSMTKWKKLQDRKWAEVSAGKKNVTWTLEVQSVDRKTTRIVKLIIPSPAPHWGSAVWRAPEGRVTATVTESGPLAERAKEILDHGQWSMANLRMPWVAGIFQRDYLNPFLGYMWSIPEASGTLHRMFVTQQRGRTEIIFEVRTKERLQRDYLTTPDGDLKSARSSGPSFRSVRTKGEAIPPDQALAEFEREKEFWLERVHRGRRWPFEIAPGKPGAPDELKVAKSGGGAAGQSPAGVTVPAPEFLKLPAANAAQTELFLDALAKIGADAEHWAYTETSHGVEDRRITVVRVDPSKPEEERTVLLKIDGRTPNAADIKKWREEGRDSSAALGDLPPIRPLLNAENIRIAGENDATVVFELPVPADSRDFPGAQFQALFRVNKKIRGPESFSVKMRSGFRVTTGIKVTEAGLEARFQSFDPGLAPQPVYLRAGGAIRVTLIKFARDFESTRMDFKRVVPFEAIETAGEK